MKETCRHGRPECECQEPLEKESILCVPCSWYDVLEWATTRIGVTQIPVCEWHYFNKLSGRKK